MEEWLDRLIALAIRPVRDIAVGARDRIVAVYTAFTSAFSRTRVGFGYWVGKGTIWASAQLRHALVIAATLRWVIRVAGPTWVDRAVERATAWARRHVADALALARREWTQLLGMVTHLARDALSGLLVLRSWATGKINELIIDVRWVRDRVRTLLGSPEALAAWAAGAIITAVVGYLADHAGDIIEALWRRRTLAPRIVASLADMIIERIL